MTLRIHGHGDVEIRMARFHRGARTLELTEHALHRFARERAALDAQHATVGVRAHRHAAFDERCVECRMAEERMRDVHEFARLELIEFRA